MLCIDAIYVVYEAICIDVGLPLFKIKQRIN